MYFIDNNTLYFPPRTINKKQKNQSIMADNDSKIYTANEIEHTINRIPTTLPPDIQYIFQQLLQMPASNNPTYIQFTNAYEQSRNQHVRGICNGFMHIIIRIEVKMNADSALPLSSRIETIQILQATKALIDLYKNHSVPNAPLVQVIRNITHIYKQIKTNPDYKVSYAQYLPIFLKLKNKMKEFYLLAEGFPYSSGSISTNQNLSHNYGPSYVASNIFKQSSSSNTNNMNFYAEDDVSF